jgi:hypothetical protein
MLSHLIIKSSKPQVTIMTVPYIRELGFKFTQGPTASEVSGLGLKTGPLDLGPHCPSADRCGKSKSSVSHHTSPLFSQYSNLPPAPPPTWAGSHLHRQGAMGKQVSRASVEGHVWLHSLHKGSAPCTKGWWRGERQLRR